MFECNRSCTDAGSPPTFLHEGMVGIQNRWSPHFTQPPETHDHCDQLLSKLRQRLGIRQLIGQGVVFTKMITDISAMSQTDATVLIVGETGTGKELSARAIHYLSDRSDHPFIPVNCGAIPVDLVENELFGHDRGAYTGASFVQEGVVREAEGGTLFLDEIDAMPLAVQVKFLRFLQEKEYRPLGSAKIRQANVRIIAATNANVEQKLAEGTLRRDLYYRVNTLLLTLPPLRQRPEDISVLARYFLAKYAKEYKKSTLDLAPEALQLLQLYEWPGNVRELEHVIARAVALAAHPILLPADLSLPQPERLFESFRVTKARMVAEFEKSYIHRLLLAYDGNIARAAHAAGKHRRAFWELMRKHKLHLTSLRDR